MHQKILVLETSKFWLLTSGWPTAWHCYLHRVSSKCDAQLLAPMVLTQIISVHCATPAVSLGLVVLTGAHRDSWQMAYLMLQCITWHYFLWRVINTGAWRIVCKPAPRPTQEMLKSFVVMAYDVFPSHTGILTCIGQKLKLVGKKCKSEATVAWNSWLKRI